MGWVHGLMAIETGGLEERLGRADLTMKEADFLRAFAGGSKRAVMGSMSVIQVWNQEAVSGRV